MVEMELEQLQLQKINLETRVRALGSEMFAQIFACRTDEEYNARLDYYFQLLDELKNQIKSIDNQIIELSKRSN